MTARDDAIEAGYQCCEPGCSAEVLCPVHEALADLRERVEALRLADFDQVWRSDVLALLGGESDG